MAADRVMSMVRGGARMASLPLRGTAAVIDAGLAVEQRTRAALTAMGGRMALELLDALLTSDAIDLVLERIEAAGVAQRVAQRILEDGIAEQVVTLLLESKELWVLVDEIARSPSVTEAITHQSAGFVDQVTDTVRDRSREADAWMERAARRIRRRRKNGPPLQDGEDPPLHHSESPPLHHSESPPLHDGESAPPGTKPLRPLPGANA